jgi:4-aminobutyrate aminotransferase-like enzyme
MRYFVDRYPGKFAGLMIELVQGEGGFNYAPREFYVQVFEEARRLGLAIWVDEIQTFGRTGELFAYQTFGLHAFVDVVTVAKALQTGMILYTEEYNPRPGLIAGTFTGSISGLRAGRRVLELLDEGGYLGPQGRVARLSDHFASRLEALAAGPCQGALTEIRRIGGMIAFRPGAGTLEEVKAYLARLFDLGVVAFYCGHDPYLVRLLPPLGAMTEEDIARVCELIGKAFAPLARVAAEDDGSSGRQGPVGGQK